MAIFGKTKTESSEEKTSKDETTSVKTVAGKAGKTDAKKTSMKDLYGDVKATDSGKSKEETKNKNAGFAYKILIKPLITEKAANLGKENKYVFEVEESTNKIEIAKAIEEIYHIKPLSVNVVRVGGKKVRSGKRAGKRKDWKKAVITLPAGKTINIYEGV